MDRAPRVDFLWTRLGDGDLPLEEIQRIDDRAGRAIDEQGGDAGDAAAQPGMGLEITPPGLRAVWGVVGDPYTAEGESVALYYFTQVVHDGNVAEAAQSGVSSVALEVNANLNVPAGTVAVFWPSEDSYGGQGEKWRFSHPVAPTVAEADVGDGSNTTYTVTHDLDTTNLIVQVIESSTGLVVYPDVAIPTSSTVTVTFDFIPTTSQYKVVLVSGGGTTAVPVAGPGLVTDTAIALWDGTGGTLLKNSVVLIGTTGTMTGVLSISGGATDLTIYGSTQSGGNLILRPTTHATPGKVISTVTSGDTTTGRTVFELRHLTTATAAPGFGTTIAFAKHNASGALTTAVLVTSKWTTATGGGEEADLVFELIRAGVPTEAARFLAGGGILTPSAKGGTASGGTLSLQSTTHATKGGVVISPGDWLNIPEVSAPATPGANTIAVYGKSDGKVYSKDDAGNEYDLTDAGDTRTEGTLAAAGSTQGDAAAITTDATLVSGADGTKGVILWDKVAAQLIVGNTAAGSTLKVYPPVGGNFGSGSANAPDTITTKQSKLYVRLSSTQWVAVSYGAIV